MRSAAKPRRNGRQRGPKQRGGTRRLASGVQAQTASPSSPAEHTSLHHALLVSGRALDSDQGQKSNALIERPDDSRKMTVDLLTVT